MTKIQTITFISLILLTLLVIIISIIARSKHKKEKIKLSRDSLTGIYNKDYFELKVRELLDNSEKEYSIIYTDIKNFKLINNYYGNEYGDKVLISIANKLKELYENSEDITYGRISNDNFVICLPKEICDAKEIKKELDFINKNLDFKIYLYIGIYNINDKTIPVSLMIDNANIAVREIKNSYNKFVSTYNENLKELLYKEQKLISDFNDAIINDEFIMYLQPQISNSDNKIVGAEALARWERKGNLIIPGEFIPIFEKTGLITELDTHIWELACKKLKEWENNDIYISINISPIDFYYLDVYKTINKLVDKYKIDPSRLKLEITETVVMKNIEEVITIINKFRNKGFIVELDDFGSGYSSLNLLKDINVDVVKMDMMFLYKPTDIKKCETIIETLVNLSKKLGMKVVCEGVENKKQLEFLSKIGCDVYQGYYFDKPIRVDEFEKKYIGVTK